MYMGRMPLLLTVASALMAALALAGTASADLCNWRANKDVCDFCVDGGVVRGRVCGSDPQVLSTIKDGLAPKGNHFVRFRMKVATNGTSGQLFWRRSSDSGFSGLRMRPFRVVGDGQWHDYRVQAGWIGEEKIVQLRIDLPPEYTDATVFEIADVRIVEEGEELIVDTREKIGVAFSLQVPEGLHYGLLKWFSDEAGQGEFDFSTASDGKRHEYWFDLRKSQGVSWHNRKKPIWKGRLSLFEIESPHAKKPLPVENLRFVSSRPDTPADPVLTSVSPCEAIPRAGRPFGVEAVVRNFGTAPATNVRFAFDGLPDGVVVLEPERLSPPEPLPGMDGTERLGCDWKAAMPHERVYVLRLSDLGVGVHRFGVTMTANGVEPQRVEVVADVKPSLGLKAESYPPEPSPVCTAPYEIGALIFPGWKSHHFHVVTSYDPGRKPLLGWYDEANPETIDWQIKHLVENGVSFVSVCWFWRDGRLGTHHWMDAFAKAKYRKYLKWHVMWDNEANSPEDQEKVARFWCENYFTDPQYQKIDGRPVVTLFNSTRINKELASVGGMRRIVEITRRVAREHGFPDVYMVARRETDAEDRDYLKGFVEYGFDHTAVYGFRGNIPGAKEGGENPRPFKWIADFSPSHWRALLKNGELPFWPSLSTGYDDRPWRGERVLTISGYNAEDFRRICQEGRKFADETGVRTFLMGPLDEWGEGSLGYPNRRLGFGILEAVRDTFAAKPSEGWPTNYAPEDVGLVCPQKANP